MSFLNKYKIINKNQFGFQSKKSTQDALIKLTTRIHNNVEKSKPTIAAFLDIQKAFDTVHHNTLLNILFNYGFRGKILQLLKSYLENRT